jgi:hypothetical protein
MTAIFVVRVLAILGAINIAIGTVLLYLGAYYYGKL